MPAKPYAYLRPEVPQDAADAVSRTNLLGIFQGHPDWHAGSEGSHAVSESGEALENRIAEVKFDLPNSDSRALVALQELVSSSLNASSQILGTHVQQQSTGESVSTRLADEIYVAFRNELFQNFLLWTQGMLAQPLSTETHEPVQLVNELHTAFEAEPLEDGMSHPAELIIEQALQSSRGEPVLNWLKALCLDVEHHVLSASIFRCLGRQTAPGTSEWRAELVREGLSLDSVEIRDAAVQAAELWDDENLADTLKSHDEPELWLHEYIEEVLHNWSN